MALKLKELATVSLQADTLALLDLPPPESAELSGSPTQTVAALDNLFSLWVMILVENANIPIEEHEYVCDRGHKYRVEGAELRGRLLLSITGYFDHIVRNYMTTHGKKAPRPFPKALRISNFERFIISRDDAEADPRIASFRLLSYKYFYTLLTLYVTSGFLSMTTPRGLSAEIESFAHEGLRDLNHYAFGVVGSHERLAGRRLAQGVLDFAADVYGEVPKWDKEHHLGPFSAIRLQELSLLANRDESVMRRYGKKNVERVFETQLALVMQSFGLYVVSTRTGQSTVDLVCISASPEERVTFILEAKTTKATYALPKTDFRALQDYMKTVRRSLSTLPPPSPFVL